MYKINLLPSAVEDIHGITKYISEQLNNHQAASNLFENIIREIIHIQIFPYGNTIYSNFESSIPYYKTNVKNYFIFYKIDEKDKIITIARVIYQKRDINNIVK